MRSVDLSTLTDIKTDVRGFEQLERAEQIPSDPNRPLILCQQATHNSLFIQACPALQLPAGAWWVACSGQPCTRMEI
jgi:hypothetical protein